MSEDNATVEVLGDIQDEMYFILGDIELVARLLGGFTHWSTMCSEDFGWQMALRLRNWKDRLSDLIGSAEKEAKAKPSYIIWRANEIIHLVGRGWSAKELGDTEEIAAALKKHIESSGKTRGTEEHRVYAELLAALDGDNSAQRTASNA